MRENPPGISPAPGIANRGARSQAAATMDGGPKWMLRYTYYAFIFSVPFESVALGISVVGTLPKLIGVLLIALTLLQPHLCWKLPPAPFWLFVAYLYLHAVWGGVLILSDSELTRQIIVRFLTLCQLVVLFWISCNLLQYKRLVKGALLTLIVSCTVVGVTILAGLTGEGAARATVGDANPNTVGAILGLGIIALAGLKSGEFRNSTKLQLSFLFCFAIMAIGLVRTQSRGALLALLAALLVFPLSRANLVLKLKIGFATLIAVIVLVFAAYQIEAVRLRWEMTFREGDLAGREEIYSYALEMVREQPLIGWGPMNNRVELGSRLGLAERDLHNLYLYLLTEAGVLGALPFFLGLGLCLRAAWRARNTFQGALPLAMLLFFLAVNLKGTYLNKKMLWVVLAYSVASASFVVSPVRSYAYFRTRNRELTERMSDARVR